MAKLKSPALLLAAAIAVVPVSVSSYSFSIDNTPSQCSNLSISITGSGGVPPYSALIIPFGSSPLPNAIEARTIVNQNFSGSSTQIPLKYPTNSQFVLLISDANGFATGGTSTAATVLSSDDSSCYDSTKSVSPDFFINIAPANQMILTCQPIRLWWDPSAVTQTPILYGVIPGGDSFFIPNNNNITSVSEEGDGFQWIPNVRAGTTIIIGGGYPNQLGAGGSVQTSVSAGINPDSSCLNSDSPSSTPGSPAGGSYPTSTTGAGTGSSGGSKTNVGAIVGGVIGGVFGVLAILLLLLFLRRRRNRERRRSNYGKRPDLFDNDDSEHPAATSPQDAQLQPVPFIVPPETAEASGAAEGVGHLSEEHRRLSTMTGSSMLRPGTPGTSTVPSSSATRKSAAPPSLRPVNIIQHDDAGVAPGPDNNEEEAETVELPPAYTNIRRES